MRNGTRLLLHGLLNHVPLPLQLPLRSECAAPSPGSVRERALGAALEVVRLRDIPSEVFSLPDRSDVLFTRADSLILERAYWMGRKGWERQLLGWWQHFCQRSANIVEIGPNVGYHTVQGALASPSSSFVAVEPHPFSAAALRRNLELNGIGDVQVIEAAATDGQGPPKLNLAMR